MSLTCVCRCVYLISIEKSEKKAIDRKQEHRFGMCGTLQELDRVCWCALALKCDGRLAVLLDGAGVDELLLPRNLQSTTVSNQKRGYCVVKYLKLHHNSLHTESLSRICVQRNKIATQT
jgi:hypothetical protein